MTSIPQFVLTRFNVPINFGGSEAPLGEDWLERRFDLFETFCLPSVAAQTESKFVWLLLLDDSTPNQWLERLSSLLTRVAPSEILLKPSYSEAAFIDAILGHPSARGADRVVTTRLDNDDAIASGFLATVAKLASEQPAERHTVIDFPYGCQLAAQGLFLVRSRLNPFLSMVSPTRDLKTGFRDQHRRMDRHGKVVSVGNVLSRTPYWLQVIHGGNASNELERKRRILPASALAPFHLEPDWDRVLQCS